MTGVEALHSHAMSFGIIECSDCGVVLDPDAEECLCGWTNPLVKEGWI